MTKKKVRHQVKSKFYYLFWGTATTSVLVGQLFVGTSYNRMADSMNRWFGESVDALIDGYVQRNSELYDPYVRPPTSDYMDEHHIWLKLNDIN